MALVLAREPSIWQVESACRKARVSMQQACLQVSRRVPRVQARGPPVLTSPPPFGGARRTMKVLVTGVNGQVGWELARRVPAGITLDATDRTRLDLAADDVAARVIARRPT